MAPSAQKPKVSIVVAITSKNGCIGNGANLLFRISDDLKRFKQITSGHAVILGRKTYQSIGKALPNRDNFIVTRNKDFSAPDAVVINSIPLAIEKAWEKEKLKNQANPEIFLIGGGEIYTQGLPFTQKLYLTLIESDAHGDIFFPPYPDFTHETFREKRVDEKTGLIYTWIDLERA
jgi:dihydrofolate reductase